VQKRSIAQTIRSVNTRRLSSTEGWSEAFLTHPFCTALHRANVMGIKSKQPEGVHFETEPYFCGTEIVMLR
jgi:hypothetical protein